MTTVFATPRTVRRDWYVVDATGKTLGRLASQLALRLRGKHKAAVHAARRHRRPHRRHQRRARSRVTGNKLTDKFYHQHTGYLGNLKSRSARQAARRAPRARHRVRGQGHASEEPARPQDVQEAARVRGRRAPARRAAAEAARDLRRPAIPWPATTNYGTGRRKTSTARVFLRPGNGKIIVNERTLDEFFGRKTARMIVRQPLEAVQHGRQASTSKSTVDGRRHHRPGRRDPSRHHARADRVRRDAAQAAARRRLRHARRARGRAQEGRLPQGPPRNAVLEALIACWCDARPAREPRNDSWGIV